MDIRGEIRPRDAAERQSLIHKGWEDRLDTQFMSRDLARGKTSYLPPRELAAGACKMMGRLVCGHRSRGGGAGYRSMRT